MIFCKDARSGRRNSRATCKQIRPFARTSESRNGRSGQNNSSPGGIGSIGLTPKTHAKRAYTPPHCKHQHVDTRCRMQAATWCRVVHLYTQAPWVPQEISREYGAVITPLAGNVNLIFWCSRFHLALTYSIDAFGTLSRGVFCFCSA